VGASNRRGLFAASDFLWSGAWMAFLAHEHPRSDQHYGRLFDAFENLFRAIHGLCPLAEVVHCSSVSRGVGAWDAWSHARQAWPSPTRAGC
jgi:hypothetical protein